MFKMVCTNMAVEIIIAPRGPSIAPRHLIMLEVVVSTKIFMLKIIGLTTVFKIMLRSAMKIIHMGMIYTTKTMMRCHMHRMGSVAYSVGASMYLDGLVSDTSVTSKKIDKRG
jgi:hypothetical protein